MSLFSKLFGKGNSSVKKQAECPYLFNSGGFGLYCDIPKNSQRIPLIEGLGGIGMGHINKYCRGSFKTCPLYK